METVGGAPVLRFERRFAHPVKKVWRAVSEPAELKHWFPAMLETELKIGAPIRFVFPEEAPIDAIGHGEILELDPPKVFAFRWNHDVLRFELVPDGDGCLLYFSQALGGGSIGRLAAGRNAAGWDHCLGSLAALLDGRTAEPFTEPMTAIGRYVERFGLAEGEVTKTGAGYEIRFARDLVWKPCAQVWRLLTDEGFAGLSGDNLTRSEEPRVLEYATEDGVVRWELHYDELGSRVELTQTVPDADRVPELLARWHIHLDRLFAAAHGQAQPADDERAGQLAAYYRDRVR
ncbi:SRPBCC family protein [Amycolatopsis sp. K13G38]|uniref:SRPBCC family protein n=1 Tax=Amycolatopsis acididurans TaxID=2724524 RepID=A0ABX1JER9_9PSEU|nr:SRPBCC family protein [Amycolatopsis acididurans]